MIDPRRCPRPRCGRLPSSYREVWSGHALEFDADEMGYASEEGYTSEGHPICVIATCPNGHSWRLRGVKQITELQKEAI